MTDRALEIACFTLRSGRCGLCGSDALTALPTGFRCQCGAISLTSTPRPENALDAERREDEAQLADYRAAEGIGTDRSFGG